MQPSARKTIQSDLIEWTELIWAANGWRLNCSDAHQLEPSFAANKQNKQINRNAAKKCNPPFIASLFSGVNNSTDVDNKHKDQKDKKKNNNK